MRKKYNTYFLGLFWELDKYIPVSNLEKYQEWN